MKLTVADMIPLSALADAELVEMGQRAADYLSSHRWCRRIREGRLAFGVDGVVGVFLFTIEPVQPHVDDVLWVVVGDVPPAYLVCDDAPNWRAALASYVYEMRRWIAAVRAGTSLDEVIPVSAAATTEHADMLESRLDFIQTRLIDDSAVRPTEDL